MKQLKELLFELSAKLISVPPSDIGREIEAGLKLIGEFWDFDRITLTEFSDEGDEIRIVHSYTVPGVTKAPLNKIDDGIPWIIAKLRLGEKVVLSKLPHDLPDEAKTDRRYFIKEGLKSALALPVKIGSSILGGFFLASFHQKRNWNNGLVRELYYLAEILASALERIRAAEQINELMRFEHLLSEISATYINLPHGQLDIVIRNDLGRLGRLLGADRCVLYSRTEDKKQFRWNYAHMWWPEEDDEIIKSLDAWKEHDWDFFEHFRYAFDKWSHNEVVLFSGLDEFPEEASRLKEIYQRFGVKSSLSVPMSVAGSTVGALVIATTRKHRNWPEDLVQRLRLFGEVFANGLMRKRNEEEIQQAISEIKNSKTNSRRITCI